MTKDANDNIKYDEKTLKIIRSRVRKIEKIMQDYQVDLEIACKRANIKQTTYKRDKQILGEGLEEMETIQLEKPTIKELHPHQVIDSDTNYQTQPMHRVSVDLPDDVYKIIADASTKTPFKIKAISEHLIIELVREKQRKGERLI